MADALLSSLVSAILRNLNSLALQEFGIAWGLKTELENLKSTLSTIQAVLQDAEAKQWRSEAVKNWLRKLKDVAYDADNVVDEFATEALKRKLDSQRSARHQVSTFFSLRNRLIFRLKMGHKMKDVRERLDAIARERGFHLELGVMETEVCEVESRQTSSLVNESEIYGRNEEKEVIIEKLLNNLSDQADVSVYAICGMGGIGKTALAQLVYNDGRVERNFELRIWVCVSDDFHIGSLARAILESIAGERYNFNLDPLLQLLIAKLSGRRFLLVLDDVWNEYQEKWDGLKDALRCGAKGSMVIATTRIQKVALIMATLPVHHMACLSDDDSWSLFKHRAFGIERREKNDNLDPIGRAIVAKCGGLPLAIKALGGLMRLKESESEWLSVQKSEIWDLSDNGSASAILPALRLSYDNLLPYLRQCFAYCSIFPKDYPMKKDMLIELWMANGFIPSKGQMTLHDMGHEIFNDLVWRSFFQDVKEDYEGDTICKMHDLMHDLAQSIMSLECSIVEPHKGFEIPEKVRHLSFSWPSIRYARPNEVVLKVQSLQSFILLQLHCGKGSFRPLVSDTFLACISKQKHLRVLDLKNNINVEKLSASVYNFNHLRYLDMSYSPIVSLPVSVSDLLNLQTLKLQGCYQLRELPKHMKQMTNLTRLDIRWCGSLTSMPAKMGQLTCLRSLSTFIVGQDDGYQIGELKELDLGGELTIKELDNVRNSGDAEGANLKGKQRLISLNLCWGESNRENLPNNVEEVLEGLQPNSNLKKLSIMSYKGSKFPNWMSGSVLRNLVEITLQSCAGCEHLPPLGKLPALKILKIDDMDSVKYFDHECYGDGEYSFPALKTLRLHGMLSLEEWTTVDRGEIFPRLQDLTISTCRKLTKLPFLPTLVRLKIRGASNVISDSDGIQYLTALQKLQISECPEIQSFSKCMQQLNALRNLKIKSCEGLFSLPSWLGTLHSLSKLEISNCPNLRSLSDGLHGYKTLKTLEIRQCPHLERQYKKESGEDWPKIAHVPMIWINYKVVQLLDRQNPNFEAEFQILEE